MRAKEIPLPFTHHLWLGALSLGMLGLGALDLEVLEFWSTRVSIARSWSAKVGSARSGSSGRDVQLTQSVWPVITLLVSELATWLAPIIASAWWYHTGYVWRAVQCLCWCWCGCTLASAAPAFKVAWASCPATLAWECPSKWQGLPVQKGLICQSQVLL